MCWGCTKCKFYYCAQCKGYKIDVCPSNHALATKSFTQKEDAFCDICSSPIINSALHCNKCKFNVCNICENAKKSNKSNKKWGNDFFCLFIMFIFFILIKMEK